MSVTGTLLGGLAAVGGLAGLGSLAKVFVDRTKIRADAVAEIATTSVGLLQPLHAEIDRLNSKLRVAESELDALRQQMRELSGQQHEVEALRDKLRVAEQARELLYDELAEKARELADRNRLLAQRDREIAKLRANLPPGA